MMLDLSKHHGRKEAAAKEGAMIEQRPSTAPSLALPSIAIDHSQKIGGDRSLASPGLTVPSLVSQSGDRAAHEENILTSGGHGLHHAVFSHAGGADDADKKTL